MKPAWCLVLVLHSLCYCSLDCYFRTSAIMRPRNAFLRMNSCMPAADGVELVVADVVTSAFESLLHPSTIDAG
jgi:hypothetical protein